MKNKLYLIILLLTIFIVVGFSLYSSSNKTLTLSTNTNILRKEYQEAVIEIAYQYYDAVKMKPNEVLITNGIIFGISILLYFEMKKLR